MRVDEKWKRNGDFSSTFVLTEANHLRTVARCVKPSLFSTAVVSLFVTRSADEMRLSTFQTVTNEVTA